ncbi:MAG: SEC-C domain-containing protein [Luteolibacter sp.]|uniref:YecA family protein n=2 Tax=Luteolibacter sp. TaxID=1962973 RepID=UPI00326461F0
MKGICRLCEQDADLQESHIIPKFAIRWMKDTGTGYFRRIANPNIRLQDGAKMRLLCRECEQRFSEPESYFASKLFRPFLSGQRRVNYDSRLAYFVVSLLWRALQRNRNEALETTFSRHEELFLAEKEWREYLLGRGSLTRFNHFHIFIADITVENPPGAPKFNQYCARAFDVTFFELSGNCYVVVKFSRFFFVGMLSPYSDADWVGTRIDCDEGTLSTPQEIRDVLFGSWLVARAKFAYEKFDSAISSNQLQVISDHIGKNLPRLQRSDLFRVINADFSDHERILSSSKMLGRNDQCPCGSGQKFKKCHGSGR